MSLASLTLNGYDCSAINLFINRTPYISVPSHKQSEIATPQLIGSHFEFLGTGSKTVSFNNCHISGDDEDDVRDNLGILMQKLDAMKNIEVSIQLNAMTDRYWMGRYAGGMEVDFYGNVATFSLSFLCSDPRMYSTTETVVSATIDDPYFELAITPEGNAIIDPVIYLLSAAEAAIPTYIEHLETDKRLRVRQTWSDYDKWLKIDCGQTVQTVYSGEPVGSPYDYDDVTVWTKDMNEVWGVFPQLNPGVVNTIRVEQLTNGSKIRVVYRKRYWI